MYFHELLNRGIKRISKHKSVLNVKGILNLLPKQFY